MEEFKGDKRTKEYKDWKAKFEKEQEAKPEGLGDVVESITKATGIKKIVDFIAGEDCGCEERKEKLNKMFHFDRPKCLTEEEYIFLTDFVKTKKIRVTFQEREELYKIYNRVFSLKLKVSSCPSCISNMIKKFEAILKTYK